LVKASTAASSFALGDAIAAKRNVAEVIDQLGFFGVDLGRVFGCSVTIVKAEPGTCCDGQQANQNDQCGEPPVCGRPANSPKPLLGASKSSNTAGIGHIHVSAQVVRKSISLACIVF